MGFHVISRLRTSAHLAPSRAALRRLASVVLGFGAEYGLVLFHVAGDHIHSVVRCERRTAGRWARAFEAALTVVLALEGGFRPAHILPVRDTPHFAALRPYVLGQNEKHELQGDPLLEGSNALDLLSVRLVDRDSARLLMEALPSTRTSDIDRWLGGPLKPGSDVRWLPEACEVVTAGTADSRSVLAVRVKRAAARLARSWGLGFAATCGLLGMSRASVARAMGGSDAEAERALTLAVGLLERRG